MTIFFNYGIFNLAANLSGYYLDKLLSQDGEPIKWDPKQIPSIQQHVMF